MTSRGLLPGTAGAADAVVAVTSQRDFEQGVDIPGLGAAAYLNDFNRVKAFAASEARNGFTRKPMRVRKWG